MVRTGVSTKTLEAPWNGYEDHNKTILPLGPEKDRKPDPNPAAC